MVARDGTWRHVQVLLLRVATRVHSYIVRYSYHADILMYLCMSACAENTRRSAKNISTSRRRLAFPNRVRLSTRWRSRWNHRFSYCMRFFLSARSYVRWDYRELINLFFFFPPPFLFFGGKWTNTRIVQRNCLLSVLSTTEQNKWKLPKFNRRLFSASKSDIGGEDCSLAREA